MCLSTPCVCPHIHRSSLKTLFISPLTLESVLFIYPHKPFMCPLSAGLLRWLECRAHNLRVVGSSLTGDEVSWSNRQGNEVTPNIVSQLSIMYANDACRHGKSNTVINIIIYFKVCFIIHNCPFMHHHYSYICSLFLLISPSQFYGTPQIVYMPSQSYSMPPESLDKILISPKRVLTALLNSPKA